MKPTIEIKNIEGKEFAFLIGRASFFSFLKPPVYQGEIQKYKVDILIPKDVGEEVYQTLLQLRKKHLLANQNVSLIKNLIEKVKKEPKQDVGARRQLQESFFLKDGDLKIDAQGNHVESYANHWYVRASNKSQPLVLDGNNQVINREGICQNGDYFVFKLSFWTLTKQSGGVHCNLDGAKYLKKGEPLGDGGSVAEVDDFTDFNAIDELEEFGISPPNENDPRGDDIVW